MSHVPGTFCWFECATRDAAAAKIFYTELFGWSSVDVPMSGDMGGQYTLLKLGEDDIAGLYEMSGPMFEGVPPHWMTYVTTADVDASAENVGALGGKVVAPPMDVPGVGRMAVIEDPTGAKIALFKLGEHRGTAQRSPRAGTFGWSELATNDTAAAQKFYTELIGWGVKESSAPMPYTEFQVDGCSVAGMMALTPQHGDAPPHWLPYVMVDDCAATTDRVGALGGQVIVPATDIPGVGQFSVLADPTGAVLATIRLQEHPAK